MSVGSLSPDPWTVKEHIISASHPRCFRRGVRDPQASRLRLHVKQYIPQYGINASNAGPLSKNGITIIFHHGVGCSKEPYEPFFADILAHPSCPPIRSIWSLDAANHGRSYLLNASEIGDEPHWFDIAHDIKHLINTFQLEMSPPLVGVAFSWGCNAMLLNASWHPRIFQALVCMEPTIETGWWHGTYDSGSHGVVGVARKKDRWPSREAARTAFAKSSYYGQFDARVFEKALQYDVVQLPDAEGGGFTLATPKSQEVAIMMRPDPPLPGYPVGEDYQTKQEESRILKGFYRSEVSIVKEAIRSISCKTLLVWSRQENSISNEPYRARFTQALGTGILGGGGKGRGQVDESFIEHGRHNFLFDNPMESAAKVALWLNNAVWTTFLQEEDSRSHEPAPHPKGFQQGFSERLKEVRPMGRMPKL